MVGLRRCVLWIAVVACLAAAGRDSTVPPEGIRDKTPAVHALINARIIVAPGKVHDKATLVIRDGVITAVGPDAAAPPDARVWDMSGRTIYPGFIDAYSELSADALKTAAPASDAGAPYWSDRVTPQLRSERFYKPDAKLNKTLRSQGVTARLLAPPRGIIRGDSALVTTGDDDGSRSIMRAPVALHARLTVSRGDNRDQYPNSPMGAVALARQAMYDADWYAKAWDAHRADPKSPRPERNVALEALAKSRAQHMPVIFDAPNELYALRADRFAREFDLPAVLLGSGREYRRLDEVKATGRSIIVPVNFPKPPDVSTPEKAMAVSLEDLMHWDIAPENAARLDAAGVSIALTSHRLKDKSAFLASVRQAVKRGLSPEAALRALTVTPAKLFGVADTVATIEPGKAADLIVTDGDVFAKKTKVLETWVDGRRYEVTPKPVVDVRGTWQVTLAAGAAKPTVVTFKLTGDPGQIKGAIELPHADKPDKANDADKPDNPDKPDAATKPDNTEAKPVTDNKLSHVSLEDAQFGCTFKGELLGRTGVARLSATVIADPQGTLTWSGAVVWADGQRSACTATRSAAPDTKDAAAPGDDDDADDKPAEKPGDKPDNKADNKADNKTENKADNKPNDEANDKPDNAKPAKPPQNRRALFPVNYPLGAFGRTDPPAQPKAVLFRDATVWTCGPQGVLDKASVLIEAGKVVAVGADLEAPAGAVIVNAQGMHITPGIIDCHSHIATDGGINETGQAITAEVRIGDFIDPDDIAIYRQLAGGTTAANILHGSANPIGGQNQVIKFRWGSPPEAMKFAAAPPGIKFALGENVKQSNWGERYTKRYPQSRMGVEQIIRDEFTAAQEYRRQWAKWNKTHEGAPPRVDLELQAIAEILEGKRLIHCHSYRQDEILALIRTTQSFNVRIATLQHVLEGYKVADVMAKAGIMGSTFSDWWAYKFEVYDAIPYNGALMHDAGVVVSFNSDSAELGRRLNLEAAKATKYGDVPPVEALKFVTLNPAIQLHIDKRVGSLEPGKDADLVLWNRPPMSIYTVCQQTWIDGRNYFDRADDLAQRKLNARMRAAIIQRILGSGQPMAKPDEQDDDKPEAHVARDDVFGLHGAATEGDR